MMKLNRRLNLKLKNVNTKNFPKDFFSDTHEMKSINVEGDSTNLFGLEIPESPKVLNPLKKVIKRKRMNSPHISANHDEVFQLHNYPLDGSMTEESRNEFKSVSVKRGGKNKTLVLKKSIMKRSDCANSAIKMCKREIKLKNSFKRMNTFNTSMNTP